MTPIQHAPGLWTVEQTLPLAGVRFPLRSTLLRLSSGGLMVISPLPRIAEAEPGIRALGEVKALVAPNLMHHLGLTKAHALFPEAKVLARPGLAKKAKDAPITDRLTGTPDPLWADDVDQLEVSGMKPVLDEVAFFHRASRTLVLTDLCFHIVHSEHWPTRLAMRLNRAYGRFGPSRVMRSLIVDKGALRASVDRMLAWEPERVVVAHGDVIEADGRRRLEEAFAFL